MSDLKDLMDEAVHGYLPRLDEDDVRRRVGRRRLRGRAMATAVAVGVFAGAGWFGWVAMRPSSTTVPPATDSGTYVLSDLEVDPYTGPRSPDGRATVSFQLDWSSFVYPGEHECSVRVLDSTGKTIGSETFEMIALSEGHRSKLDVSVEGVIDGATAEGSCSAERLDTPVAYETKDIRIEISHVGTRTLAQVVFRVQSPDDLPAGAYPGSNACQAAILTQNGEVIGTHDFTVTVGAGRDVEADFPFEAGEVPSSIDDLIANVVCEPFTREGEFPDAT